MSNLGGWWRARGQDTCTARRGPLPGQASSHCPTASHLLALSLKEDTMCQNSRHAGDEADKLDQGQTGKARRQLGLGRPCSRACVRVGRRGTQTSTRRAHMDTHTLMALATTLGPQAVCFGVRWPQGPGTGGPSCPPTWDDPKAIPRTQDRNSYNQTKV